MPEAWDVEGHGEEGQLGEMKRQEIVMREKSEVKMDRGRELIRPQYQCSHADSKNNIDSINKNRRAKGNLMSERIIEVL